MYAQPIQRTFDNAVQSNLSILRGFNLDQRAASLMHQYREESVRWLDPMVMSSPLFNSYAWCVLLTECTKEKTAGSVCTAQTRLRPHRHQQVNDGSLYSCSLCVLRHSVCIYIVVSGLSSSVACYCRRLRGILNGRYTCSGEVVPSNDHHAEGTNTYYLTESGSTPRVKRDDGEEDDANALGSSDNDR